MRPLSSPREFSKPGLSYGPGGVLNAWLYGGWGAGEEESESCMGSTKSLVCEPAGAQETMNWSFVGEGHGRYKLERTYNFVGDGMGAYNKEVVTTYQGWQPRWCTIRLFMGGTLAGIILLLYYLATLEARPWNVFEDDPVFIKNTSETVAPVQHLFDCAADKDNDKDRLSAEQKDWCCRHNPANHGCGTSSTLPPLPFDCHSHVNLTAKKAQWCCSNEGSFCGAFQTRTVTVTATATTTHQVAVPTTEVVKGAFNMSVDSVSSAGSAPQWPLLVNRVNIALAQAVGLDPDAFTAFGVRERGWNMGAAISGRQRATAELSVYYELAQEPQRANDMLQADLASICNRSSSVFHNFEDAMRSETGGLVVSMICTLGPGRDFAQSFTVPATTMVTTSVMKAAMTAAIATTTATPPQEKEPAATRYVFVGFGTASEARLKCGAHSVYDGLAMPKAPDEQRSLEAAVKAAQEAGELGRTWPNDTIWLSGHYSKPANSEWHWVWDDGTAISHRSGLVRLAARVSKRLQIKEPWLCMSSEWKWHASPLDSKLGIFCEQKVQAGHSDEPASLHRCNDRHGEGHEAQVSDVERSWCCNNMGRGCPAKRTDISYVLVGFGTTSEARRRCLAYKGVAMPKTAEEQGLLQEAVELAVVAGKLSQQWPNNTIWLGGHWDVSGGADGQWEWDDATPIESQHSAATKLASMSASSKAQQRAEPWLCMVLDGTWHDSEPLYQFGIMCKIQVVQPSLPLISLSSPLG